MAPRQAIRARGIVDGTASGPALVGLEPISFLGDVDIRSGRIVGDLPSLRGQSVRGRVLVFPYTRGSAGAWRFLYQLFKHGNHPVAMVTKSAPDPSVVQGAILAHIPVVCEPEGSFFARVQNGDVLTVEASSGVASIVVNQN